jgi:hypothetical protein
VTLAKKRRVKRNNKFVLLLLPALIFIFFMGWSMYWIGNQKRPEKSKPKAPKEDNVTILPAVFEETPQIMNE